MRHTTYAIRNTQYDFAGKKVLIMGLGRFGGGVDAAKFAAKAGAKVIITDLTSRRQLSDSISQLEEFPDIEFHLGSHDPVDFEQADIIIANPAVPGDNEFLEIARSHKKFITSQINIFFQLCPAQIIGITGANGKSTTAALTAHLLKSAGEEKVWLSGNIGNEPLLTRLDKIAPDDLVVLELSSFQIEQLAQIQQAPTVALLTNLTPNHLDRYGTFEDYCAAKENIFKFQLRRVGFSPPNKTWWGKPHPTENRPAVSIFNAEDKIGAEWFDKYKKDAGRICIIFSAGDISERIRKSFGLPGRANLSNLAAAVAIARHFGIDDDQLRTSLPQFKALPHRLELAAQVNGVSWYNDSKATTPESAIAAIEAFEQPTIIIAGGYDKKVAFDELGQKIAESAKAAILFGQTAERIADAIRKTQDTSLKAQDTIRNTRIELVNSLAEAVQLANQLSESGDVVLLSPACASYDMFENFQQRGWQFVKLVQKIRD
ncbi:MAG: UDP-N-acetylmuramoyl-L-alanine--D-glutamate ligase [Planctomycetes bacterium]|nr:UDP-N-acetylmuramoyl-L-alanine--D-glutamate ligase [Planctomycetota bacterium]